MTKYCLLFTSFVLIYYQLVFVSSEDTFTVRIKKFNACKGPKRKNCTIFSVNSPNDFTLSFDVLVTQDVTLTYGRVSAKQLSSKNTLPFQMKKPCDHFAVRESLKQYLHVTGDCTLKKDHYKFSVNINDLTKVNSFIFDYALGDWLYHTVIYGNDCNVLCTYIHMRLQAVKN